MALINCPDCSRQVSDRAAICPDCACPVRINEKPNVKIPERPVLIEQTAKKWKIYQIYGTIVLALGIPVSWAIKGLTNDGIGTFLFISCCLISMVLFFIAGFGGWWNHR